MSPEGGGLRYSKHPKQQEPHVKPGKQHGVLLGDKLGPMRKCGETRKDGGR